MDVFEVGLLFSFSGDLSETWADVMVKDYKNIKVSYLLNESTFILLDDPLPL